MQRDMENPRPGAPGARRPTPVAALARTASHALTASLTPLTAAAFVLVPVLAAAILGTPRVLRAQEAGQAQQADPASRYYASPYLELGSWEYEILDYWIADGRINSLSPFTQPYRRMDVARAIRSLREKHLKPYEERWLKRLEAAFRPELAILDGDRRETAFGSFRFSAGAADWTQTNRDPLRPALHGQFAKNRVLDHESVDMQAEAGPVAAALRVTRDGIFLHDAEFPNGRVVPKQNLFLINESAMRVQDSYAEFQTRYARLFVGRTYRNWGPPHTLGFLRSNWAYSWNEVGWRIGTDKIFATGSLAKFDDFPGDTTRFFAVHRLEWRARKNLMIAVSEAVLEGGPNAKMDFRLLNPIGPWQLTTKESHQERNNLGQLDLWWRPVNGLALWGSLLADNTTFIRKSDKACCQAGVTVGVEMPGLVRGWNLRFQGTVMQSLVYRTVRPWEQYTVDGVGLGWDKADLRLGTIEASWFGGHGLILKPRIDIQQKGEGDFHGVLRPPNDSLPSYPRIIVGQAETTIRPALAGLLHRSIGNGWSLDMTWDVGVDFIRNYQHVKGDNTTAVVGVVKILVRTPRLLLGLE